MLPRFDEFIRERTYLMNVSRPLDGIGMVQMAALNAAIRAAILKIRMMPATSCA